MPWPWPRPLGVKKYVLLRLLFYFFKKKKSLSSQNKTKTTFFNFVIRFLSLLKRVNFFLATFLAARWRFRVTWDAPTRLGTATTATPCPASSPSRTTTSGTRNCRFAKFLDSHSVNYRVKVRQLWCVPGIVAMSSKVLSLVDLNWVASR